MSDPKRLVSVNLLSAALDIPVAELEARILLSEQRRMNERRQKIDESLTKMIESFSQFAHTITTDGDVDDLYNDESLEPWAAASKIFKAITDEFCSDDDGCPF